MTVGLTGASLTSLFIVSTWSFEGRPCLDSAWVVMLLPLPHYWSKSAYWDVRPLTYNFTQYSKVVKFYYFIFDLLRMLLSLYFLSVPSDWKTFQWQFNRRSFFCSENESCFNISLEKANYKSSGSSLRKYVSTFWDLEGWILMQTAFFMFWFSLKFCLNNKKKCKRKNMPIYYLLFRQVR